MLCSACFAREANCFNKCLTSLLIFNPVSQPIFDIISRYDRLYEIYSPAVKYIPGRSRDKNFKILRHEKLKSKTLETLKFPILIDEEQIS